MSDQPTDLQIINRELKEFRCLTQVGPIGGVCAGIAYRFGWAPWVVRLLWVCSVLSLGVGLGIYILLWIFVPKAPALPSDYSARTGHFLEPDED